MQTTAEKKKINMNGDTAQLVGEVITKRGTPAPSLDPVVQDIIAAAARSLPSWAKYLMGGGLGVILAQLIAIWGLPQRVDQIEETQQKHGALLQKVACKVGAVECPEYLPPTSRPTR